MRRLAASLLLVLLAASRLAPAQSASTAEIHSGLDTLYAGHYAEAARDFADLGRRDTLDPAGPTFHAAAYIWWAASQETDDFQRDSIYFLLDQAIRRARAMGSRGDFWLATALGYRARQHDLHGHGWRAAKDGKAMRDAYARVLAGDSTCTDCQLGLGVYQYGLARASALARFVARLLGFGSGDAERGLALMRRTVEQGTLARVEATWVLAAALEREAERYPARRVELRQAARQLIEPLAQRYPGNRLFQRFLEETGDTPS